MPGSGSSVKWLNVVVFCVLIAGLLLAWLSIPHEQPKLEALDLQPLVGTSRTLDLKSLQGKVVLLNFWGTWCPPCRAEFPHLAKLEAEWHDSPNFRGVFVSCGAGRDNLGELREQTVAFLKDHQPAPAIYADPDGRTRAAVSKAVGFRGYPTTLVLDGEGNVRGHWVGYRSGVEVEIESLVRELVGSQPAEQVAAR